MPNPKTKSWQRHASPLARQACIAYAALLVIASLYPLAGWRDAGVSPWAYLTAPWPRWLTGFDMVTNVMAYVPFGVVAVLAVHPALRGAAAVVVATVLGALLSGGLEALQTYLPNRIASNVDLGLNAAGTLLGALLVAPFASALLDRGPMRDLRRRWFERDASRGLVLVGLWLAAQLAPLPILFGFGEIVTPAFELYAELTSTPMDPPVWIDFTPEDVVANEALIAGGGLAGVALLMLELTRPNAPRFRLVLGLVALAVGARSLASAIALSAEDALNWATPGAKLGLAIGLALALA
ncbi:MAG TPA: VanZ family protein, partial [Burkholderiaceae bacterium]|nr:VanZ family protein [Burkholderiaceae bacterium]